LEKFGEVWRSLEKFGEFGEFGEKWLCPDELCSCLAKKVKEKEGITS
jgi:hypothetical protein